MNRLPAKNSIFLHDEALHQWLLFREPLEVVQTTRMDEVQPLLQEIEARTRRQQLYAAGFLSYEAAPAFDEALAVHPAHEFPLLWFGLYHTPERVSRGALGRAGEAASWQWQPSVSKARYQKAIREIKHSIAAGRTYQVNYTLRMRALLDGATRSEAGAWAYFLQLLEAQQPSFGAYVDTGQFAICCASPELFFRLEEGRLTARPMKGTARRGLTWQADQAQAEWLHHSEKNRAENVMIVDMIRNDVGRVADIGTVSVPHLFTVEKYPNVWQMTSTVTAQTRQPVSEVVRALFPCASITGAPKHSTMRIISQLEEAPRRIYTGSIGYMTPQGNAQFNVAIRTVLVDRQQGMSEYGVGGGVVWDSTDEGEWAECIAKADILTSKRPTFSLLETMLWRRGDGYFLLDTHLQRLARSADYFDFALDGDDIARRLKEAARTFTALAYRVRLLAARDGGIELQSAPLAADPDAAEESWRVCLAPAPVSSDDVFLYHKTTQRAVYERMQRSCPGYDDVILWNERGEITESCLANVVVELDGERITPPVASGLLAGTYRQWLLDQGLVREGVLSRDDLARCSGMWLVNSVRGEIKVRLEADLSRLEAAAGG